MKVIKLNESHIDEFNDLLDSRHDDGTTFNIENIRIHIAKYLNSTNERGVFGTFNDDGSLMSTCGWVSWNEWSPTNTMTFLTTHKKYVRRFSENGMAEAIDAYLKHSEDNEIFEHFYVFGTRTLKSYLRLTHTIPSHHRYNSSFEAFIPANTKPQHELHWKIMNEILVPYDVMVRSFKIKQEHHPLGKKFL